MATTIKINEKNVALVNASEKEKLELCKDWPLAKRCLNRLIKLVKKPGLKIALTVVLASGDEFIKATCPPKK